MYCRLLEHGTQASTSAVTASANIAYWSLLRGKSGPPTEVDRVGSGRVGSGRFDTHPRTPSSYAPVIDLFGSATSYLNRGGQTM